MPRRLAPCAGSTSGSSARGPRPGGDRAGGAHPTPSLEAYRRHLSEYRKPNGAPLSLASQHARLTHLRVWCAWLVRERYLADDPAEGLELPRVESRLPAVCSAAEVERVLLQPDLHDPMGLRDRAILETFYSTGMRRTELVRLALSDLDWGRRLVLIRQGKGRRDRLVPIGPRALGWVARYLAEVRPCHVRPWTQAPCFSPPGATRSTRITSVRWCGTTPPRRSSASAAPATCSATPWRP